MIYFCEHKDHAARLSFHLELVLGLNQHDCGLFGCFAFLGFFWEGFEWGVGVC